MYLHGKPSFSSDESKRCHEDWCQFKKRLRTWNRDLSLREGVVKEENFPHTQKPYLRQGWEVEVALEPQRWVKQHMLGRQNRKNSPQRSLLTNIAQLRHCLHVCCGEWGLGAELTLQVSNPSENTKFNCHEDIMRGLVGELRESRKSLRPSWTSHSCGLWPQRYICQNFCKCQRQDYQWLQFVNQSGEYGPPLGAMGGGRGSLWSLPQGSYLQPSCEWTWITAHNFLGASAAWLCQGTHNLRPTPLGKHMTCLRLWWLPAGLGYREHSPHTSTLSAAYLPTSSPTEKVSPKKLLLLPPMSGQRTNTRVWNKSRNRYKTKAKH